MKPTKTVSYEVTSSNRGSSSCNGSVHIQIDANDQCQDSMDLSDRIAEVLMKNYGWSDTNCFDSDNTSHGWLLGQTNITVEAAKADYRLAKAEAKKA